MGPKIVYDGTQVPVVVSKITMDLLLKSDCYTDAIALYMFYYYTAQWQSSFCVRAVSSYVMKALGWSEQRVQKTKKALIGIGLIENTTKKAKGVIIGHFIKVNIIWVQPEKTRECDSHSLAERGTNAYNTGSLNAYKTDKGLRLADAHEEPIDLKEQIDALTKQNKELQSKLDQIEKPEQLTLFEKDLPISVGLFDTFMSIYPNQAEKGRAFSAWQKLCAKQTKGFVRPTWKIVRSAVIAQRKSERWADPKYIPFASKWLNESRWLDDPAKMVNPFKTNRPTEKRSFGYVGERIEYKEAIKV